MWPSKDYGQLVKFQSEKDRPKKIKKSKESPKEYGGTKLCYELRKVVRLTDGFSTILLAETERPVTLQPLFRLPCGLVLCKPQNSRNPA